MVLVTTKNCNNCDIAKTNLETIGVIPETKNFSKLEKDERSKIRSFLVENNATLPILMISGTIVSGVNNILNTAMSVVM